jgi:DNA modification methylase
VRVTHESAYILAKGRPPKPARLLDDVQPWEYTGNVAHPTEKAISVIKPLVETFSPPGGLVLDPFSGSGSTAVAAALAGRLYIGVELEEKYCQLARRRLGGVERFMRRRSQRLTSRPSTRALVPNT